MDADYPAAHSMDTNWFAVDAAGQVALFSTGENGHAPEGISNDDLQDDLLALYRAAGVTEEDEGYLYNESLARQLNVYFFDYDDEMCDPVGRYTRLVCPERPLHVDELPPALRGNCRRVTFDRLDFARADHLQPIEFVRCIYWYADRVAYLCADGQTVRPIPGREAAFAPFVKDMRTTDPRFARQFVFRDATGQIL